MRQPNVPRDGSVCRGDAGLILCTSCFLNSSQSICSWLGSGQLDWKGLLASLVGQFSYLNMCVVLFAILYSIPSPCLPVHKGRSLPLGLCCTCCLPVFFSECLEAPVFKQLKWILASELLYFTPAKDALQSRTSALQNMLKKYSVKSFWK